MVEWVFCEGWCHRSYETELKIDVDGYEFTDTLDGVGDDPSASGRFHVTLTPKADALYAVMTYLPHDSSVPEDEPYRLKHLRKPFGLDVAHYEMAK